MSGDFKSCLRNMLEDFGSWSCLGVSFVLAGLTNPLHKSAGSFCNSSYI